MFRASASTGVLPGGVTIGRQAELLGRRAEIPPAQWSEHRECHATDHGGRPRKPDGRDERDPKGREHNAADARAVQRVTQRRRASPIEPRRHHGDDRGAAGGSPPAPAQDRGREQLPWRIGNRPAEHPDHQRRRAAECDRSDAEHAVRVGKARDQDRADQKMDRDRGRYDGYRPAMLFMQNIEEHGWSVVADPKTECCDGERRGNDLPSEEYRP